MNLWEDSPGSKEQQLRETVLQRPQLNQKSFLFEKKLWEEDIEKNILGRKFWEIFPKDCNILWNINHFTSEKEKYYKKIWNIYM